MCAIFRLFWVRKLIGNPVAELPVSAHSRTDSTPFPIKQNKIISTLFPRRIPRGREVEFPLSTHPIRGVEVENSRHGNT
jgi:hypothetical protein